VSRDAEFDASLGVTVHNTGTNIKDNSVEVYVEPFSAAVVDAYQRRYGPAVVVLPGTAPTVTPCSNRDNCPGPPIMAGVSNDWGCTVGFGIWMDGKRRFLTAGHCVQQVVDAYGWAGWEWFHQSVSLGLSTDESWFDYSPADAGSMGNVSSAIHSNRVLYTTQPSWFGIHSSQGVGEDYQGMAICQSGQTSGYVCGTIQSTNQTPNYSGVHMKWQRKANYLVQVGDSGAPVISQSNTNLAVGLQSGRDSLYVAYFSHIYYVLAPNGSNGGIGAAIWTYDS
jgi:streptogrisin C